VVYVDPAYTSQTCSACGHVAKKNRPDQATFCCTSCGFAEHADAIGLRYASGPRIDGINMSNGQSITVAVFRSESQL